MRIRHQTNIWKEGIFLKKDIGLDHVVHQFDNLYDGVKKEADENNTVDFTMNR